MNCGILFALCKKNKHMKKYIKTVLLILLTFGLKTVIAQNVYVQGHNFNGDFTVHSTNSKSKLDIKGNPYYNRDFMFGELQLRDGKKMKGLFRYNIYHQEFELIVEKDTLTISNPILLEKIDFGGKSFMYSLILEDNKREDFIAGAYFEVLNKGNCKVLIKRGIKLKENKYVENYGGGGGDGSHRYIPNETYYIKLSDDMPAQKLIKSKSRFVNYFGEYQHEIVKYIDANKLNINEEKDLIKLIDYYNKLNKS